MGSEVLRFDVYGRLTVLLRNAGGEWWIAEAIGSDGKRCRLPDVVIPLDAGPTQIVDRLEALYHEWARPGTRVRPIG
jgi:hypothetical protein